MLSLGVFLFTVSICKITIFNEMQLITLVMRLLRSGSLALLLADLIYHHSSQSRVNPGHGTNNTLPVLLTLFSVEL